MGHLLLAFPDLAPGDFRPWVNEHDARASGLSVDAFFPPKERTGLPLRRNGRVASPAFAAWGAGVPLDIGALLRTPEGKPRAAIVYLAHPTRCRRSTPGGARSRRRPRRSRSARSQPTSRSSASRSCVPQR
jgi:hypothetical protein